MKGLLGADIFSILLFVFIICTAMLSMNQNSKNVSLLSPAAVERSMPEVNLPKGKSEGASPVLSENSGCISIKGKDADVEYFLGDKQVSIEQIEEAMKTNKYQAVTIRSGEKVDHGKYVNMLDICNRHHIPKIVTAYTLQAEAQ